jgi:hypothetical protein
MLVPGFKQLDDPTTTRIVGLDAFDLLNGIPAAKREERIAAPFGPVLEAAKRQTRFYGALPSPAPDRSEPRRLMVGL